MKKIIIITTVLISMVGGGLYFPYNKSGTQKHATNIQPLTKNIEGKKGSEFTSISPVEPPANPTMKTKAKKEVIETFEQFLATMPLHEQEKYRKLNEQLFGVLSFSNKEEYQALLQQGFPSLNEIDYVEQFSRKDLNLILFNNASSSPVYSEEPSFNLAAISAVNLVRAVEELEEEIKYYVPEYQQGASVPNLEHWPNTERPQKITEALGDVVGAYATTVDISAIGLLAQARFKQLVNYESESESEIGTMEVFKKLSMADKKLAGNNNILEYVKQHYPNDVETYIDLRKNL